MSGWPRSVTSLYQCSTELCADAIEGHPQESGIFALGTYQVDQVELKAHLEKDDEVAPTSSSPDYTRRGRCTLRRVTTSADNQVDCEVLTSIDGPAILDMKWSKTELRNMKGNVLAVADATGIVRLHTWRNKAPYLNDAESLVFNPRKALCLSLDWSDRRFGLQESNDGQQPLSLIVSQSDGSLAYLPHVDDVLEDTSPAQAKQGEDDEACEEEEGDEDEIASHTALNSTWADKPRGLETWKAHDFEAWIAAWDCWSSGRIAWSGGDDLKLKGWDMRTSNGITGRKPTFVQSKGWAEGRIAMTGTEFIILSLLEPYSFEGGVTTAQSHHLRQHIWAIGSYDSHVRLFDARMPMRPLSSTSVGGGVWRLKWHPTDSTRLLAGCMHDGFKVLHLPSLGSDQYETLTRGEVDITHRFDGHSSLAYGCDWIRGADGDIKTKVASCSFYDAQLHVWEA